jgi:CHAT domain-containing protein
MYAGAAQVIASLWQVDDAATSEPMKRFYQRMMKEGKRPMAVTILLGSVRAPG